MQTGVAQPLPVEAPATGLNLYRPQRRVVLLLFLAPFFYEVWWYWQLFAFTRREEFPRARRFWWLLIPFYGWVVLYGQFDDLRLEAGAVGARAFSSATAIWLVIFSWWAGAASNRIGNDYGAFAAFVASGVLIAIMGLLVQPTANDYLKSKYPEAPPLGLTWGETTAAVLGIALFVLVGTVTLTSALSTSSQPSLTSTFPPSSSTARSGTAPTHVLSQLRPIAVRTGEVVRVSSSRVGCQAGRDNGAIWLDCAPLGANGAVPSSFGISISARAAMLGRFDANGTSHTLAQRAEPGARAVVAVPVPRRKAESGRAPVGAVLPIGGTPIICEIERKAQVPTLFCGLATKVTGPNNALDVRYLKSSYGVAISSTRAALVRWTGSTAYAVVAGRREPVG